MPRAPSDYKRENRDKLRDRERHSRRTLWRVNPPGRGFVVEHDHHEERERVCERTVAITQGGSECNSIHVRTIDAVRMAILFHFWKRRKMQLCTDSTVASAVLANRQVEACSSVSRTVCGGISRLYGSPARTNGITTRSLSAFIFVTGHLARVRECLHAIGATNRATCADHI